MKAARLLFTSLLLVLAFVPTNLAALEYPSISVMFANAKVDESEPSAIELAQYDMVVTQGLSKALLAHAKGLNPNLELLRTSQGPFVNIIGYGDQIRSATGFEPRFLLHKIDGTSESMITWWNDTVAFYNFALPDAVNWLIEYVKSQYDNDPAKLSYSGMYFDGLHYEIWQWMKDNVLKTSDPTIDYNSDGIVDTQHELDSAWRSGVEVFLQALKAQYPALHFAANDAPIYLDQYKGHLNGAFFENHISEWIDTKDVLWFDPWKEIVEQGNRWILESQKPALSIGGLSADPTYTDSPQFTNKYQPWEEPDLWNQLLTLAYNDRQRMRFGLGVSCLAGLSYTYDWGPYCWGKTYWWFPEYDAYGRGRHYLGSPLSPPQKVVLDANTSIVQNSGIESGSLLPWYLEAHEDAEGDAGVTMENAYSGSYCAWIRADSVQTDPGKWWYVQLQQPSLSFVAGKSYVIRFAARSSAPRKAFFQAHLSKDPWTPILQQTDFDVKEEWEVYSFLLHAEIDALEGEGRLNFYVANDSSILYLDNIEIFEGADLVYKRDFEKGRVYVYVNPTRNERTIPLERTFYLLDGSPVNQIEIGSWDATILVKDPNWSSSDGKLLVPILNLLLGQ